MMLVLVAVAPLAGCGGGGDEPLQPTDPDCVVPATSSFVDSAGGRVVTRNFSFQPKDITVRAGQTVRWIHCGPEGDQHTVTSDGSGGPLASQYFGLKQEYSFTFSSTGSYPYHCIPHAGYMTGSVTVVP